jgi:hypothetical protein
MTRRYTRKDAAKFLTEEQGVPTTSNTLAKLFCIGGGPKCRHVGRRPIYDEVDLVAWVEARLTRARASSSEPRIIDAPRIIAQARPDNAQAPPDNAQAPSDAA